MHFSGLSLWCQVSIRRSSSYLIGYFFKNSKLDLADEAPNMISTLIVLLSDSDSATVAVCIMYSLLSFLLCCTLHIMFVFNRLHGKLYRGLLVQFLRRCFLPI